MQSLPPPIIGEILLHSDLRSIAALLKTSRWHARLRVPDQLFYHYERVMLIQRLWGHPRKCLAALGNTVYADYKRRIPRPTGSDKHAWQAYRGKCANLSTITYEYLSYLYPARLVAFYHSTVEQYYDQIRKRLHGIPSCNLHWAAVAWSYPRGLALSTLHAYKYTGSDRDFTGWHSNAIDPNKAFDRILAIKYKTLTACLPSGYYRIGKHYALITSTTQEMNELSLQRLTEMLEQSLTYVPYLHDFCPTQADVPKLIDIYIKAR